MPGSVLTALGLPAYTYGGDGPDRVAPLGWTPVSPERLARYWEQATVAAGGVATSGVRSPVRDGR